MDVRIPRCCKWMYAYLHVVREDIAKHVRRDVKNITSQEESAIQSLLSYDSIVIRPSDKGSGITVNGIMDIAEYGDNILEELNCPMKQLTRKHTNIREKVWIKN